MRKYQLRIYTLDSEAALEHYSSVNCPRHLESFPKFGITAEGFFRHAGGSEPKLYTLVSFVHVESIDLVPTPGSPLG